MTRVLCSLLLLLGLLACSDDDGTTPPPPADTTPPARIQDLTAERAPTGGVTLSWTAPGEDGAKGQAAHYELRYDTVPLVESAWDSAEVVATSRTPASPGTREDLSVAGLPTGVLYFGIRTADEVPNWSELSNIAAVGALTPPDPIRDLSVRMAGPEQVWVVCTVPGSPVQDRRVVAYDLRYAESPITEGTWADAVQVPDLPAPTVAGTLQGLGVTGLVLGTHYYFVLRSADDLGAWSTLSNVAESSTCSSVVRSLTSSPRPSGATYADWSPDGAHFTFSADWNGTTQIYRGDLLDQGTEPFTHLSNGAASPNWSPGLRQISFISHRDDGFAELSIMEAIPGAPPRVLASPAGRPIRTHAWSSDGTRIAYVSRTRVSPPRADLVLIPASGGVRPEYVTGGWDLSGRIDWSPDDNRIAFSSNQGGNPDIWIVPSNGGTPVQLTTDPGEDVDCAWSPDGETIVFASNRAGSFDLWQIPADGGTARPLTADPGSDDVAPVYSAGGTTLTFTRTDARQIADIWVLSFP